MSETISRLMVHVAYMVMMLTHGWDLEDALFVALEMERRRSRCRG